MYREIVGAPSDVMAIVPTTDRSVQWETPGGRLLRIRQSTWEYASVTCITSGRYIGRIHGPFTKWVGGTQMPRLEMACVGPVTEHATEGAALAHLATMWDLHQACEEAA